MDYYKCCECGWVGSADDRAQKRTSSVSTRSVCPECGHEAFYKAEESEVKVRPPIGPYGVEHCSDHLWIGNLKQGTHTPKVDEIVADFDMEGLKDSAAKKNLATANLLAASWSLRNLVMRLEDLDVDAYPDDLSKLQDDAHQAIQHYDL